VLAGHNRPKYSKHDIAFRGLTNCAHDGCMLTGEVKKEKYVYYRCTGNRGKCDLPRFKEEELANRLGEPLKGLQVPPKIVDQIVATLREDQSHAADRLNVERARLQARLTIIQGRMDAAYTDKLDGKISEDFWERKTAEWNAEERQVKLALDGLTDGGADDVALNAQKVLELANKAYLLYVTQDSAEKAKLLRMLCWNFSVDDASVMPAYKYPFDVIFKRAKTEEWSGRRDSNSLALFPKEILYQQIGLSLRRVVPRVVPLWPGDDHGSECHQTNRNSSLGPLLPCCSEQQREDQS
jgi:site-specific DNA recombinase